MKSIKDKERTMKSNKKEQTIIMKVKRIALGLVLAVSVA